MTYLVSAANTTCAIQEDRLAYRDGFNPATISMQSVFHLSLPSHRILSNLLALKPARKLCREP
jgi:hypothetical protein